MPDSQLERPVTVEVIEDDCDHAFIIEESLRRAVRRPPRVNRHNSVANWLAARTRVRSDAMVLDLSLGDTEGIESLRAVRDEDRRIPIIVVTSLEDSDLGARLVAAGASDYLPKSELGSHQLGRCLRHAIERGHLLHDLQAALSEAREVNQRLQMLVTTTREELVRPLKAIRRIAENMSDDGYHDADRERIADNVSLISATGRSIEDTIASMLSAAQLTGQPRSAVPIDLIPLAREVFERISRHRHVSKGFGLHVVDGHAPEQAEIPPVYAPHRDLRQVLRSCMTALMASSGGVNLTCQVKSGCVELRIEGAHIIGGYNSGDSRSMSSLRQVTSAPIAFALTVGNQLLEGVGGEILFVTQGDGRANFVLTLPTAPPHAEEPMTRTPSQEGPSDAASRSGPVVSSDAD